MARQFLIAAIFAGASFTNILPKNAGASDALNVVVTIKPVHSLAAAVMDGAGTPKLLLSGTSTPHSYALKPSDAKRLSSANIVVRVSEQLETFLEKPLESLAKDAKLVSLAEIDGVKLLPVRHGGAFEDHDHGSEKDGDEHDHSGNHAEDGEPHEGYDAHLWLDPTNASTIADHLAAVFSEARPEQASGANLTFESRLRLASCSNVKFKSSTRNIVLARGSLIPTFAKERAAMGCKCWNQRTTSLFKDNEIRLHLFRAAIQTETFGNINRGDRGQAWGHRSARREPYRRSRSIFPAHEQFGFES